MMLSSGLETLESGQRLNLSMAEAGSELLAGLPSNLSTQQELDEEPNAKHGLASLVPSNVFCTPEHNQTQKTETESLESPSVAQPEFHVLAELPARILSGKKEAPARSMETQHLTDDSCWEESSTLREAREALHCGSGETSSLSKEMLCGSLMAIPVAQSWRSCLPRRCDNKSADIVERRADNQDNPQLISECLQKLIKRAPGMEAAGTRTFSRAGQTKRKHKGFPLESNKWQAIDTHLPSEQLSETADFTPTGQTQNLVGETLDYKRQSIYAEQCVAPEARQPEGGSELCYTSPHHNLGLNSGSNDQASRDSFPKSDDLSPSCCSTHVLILPMWQNPESALGVAAKTSHTTSAGDCDMHKPHPVVNTKSSNADGILQQMEQNIPLQENWISNALSEQLLLARTDPYRLCSKGENRTAMQSSSEPLSICGLQEGCDVKDSCDSSGMQDVLHYKCCSLSYMPTSVAPSSEESSTRERINQIPAEIDGNKILESDQCTVKNFNLRLNSLVREQTEENSSSLLKVGSLNNVEHANESVSACSSLQIKGYKDCLCCCGKSYHFQKFRNNVPSGDSVYPLICIERYRPCILCGEVLALLTNRNAYSNIEWVSCPSEARISESSKEVAVSSIKFAESDSKEYVSKSLATETCEPEVQPDCSNQGNPCLNHNLADCYNQLLKESQNCSITTLRDTKREVTCMNTRSLSTSNQCVQHQKNVSSLLDTSVASLDQFGSGSSALEETKLDITESKDVQSKKDVANPPACHSFIKCEAPSGKKTNEIHDNLTLDTAKYAPHDSAGCSASAAGACLLHAEHVCRNVPLKGTSSSTSEQCDRKGGYPDTSSVQSTLLQICSCAMQKAVSDYGEVWLGARLCSKTAFKDNRRNLTNTYLSFISRDLKKILFPSSLLESLNVTSKTAKDLMLQKDKQVFCTERSSCSKLKEGDSQPYIQFVDQLKNVSWAIKNINLKTMELVLKTDCPAKNRPWYPVTKSHGALALDKIVEYQETDLEHLKGTSYVHLWPEELIAICTGKLYQSACIMKSKQAKPQGDICEKTSLPEHLTAKWFKTMLKDIVLYNVKHSGTVTVAVQTKPAEMFEDTIKQDSSSPPNCQESLPDNVLNTEMAELRVLDKICHVRTECESICNLHLVCKSPPCESDGEKTVFEIELKVPSESQGQESGSVVSSQRDVDTAEFRESSQCWRSAAKLHQANVHKQDPVTCKRDIDPLAEQDMQNSVLKQSLKCPSIFKSFDRGTDISDTASPSSSKHELEERIFRETNVDITRGFHVNSEREFVDGVSGEQPSEVVLDHRFCSAVSTTCSAHKEKYSRTGETTKRMADRSELLLHSMIYSNGSSPGSSKGSELPQQKLEKYVPLNTEGGKTLSLTPSKAHSSIIVIRNINQPLRTVNIMLVLEGEEEKKLQVKKLPSETGCDFTESILLASNALSVTGEAGSLSAASVPCVQRSSNTKSSSKNTQHLMKAENHLFAEKITEVSEKRVRSPAAGERALFKRKRVHEDVDSLAETKLCKKLLTKREEQRPCTEAECFTQMAVYKADSIIPASWSLLSHCTTAPKASGLAKQDSARRIHCNDIAVCINSSINIIQETKTPKILRDQINMPLIQVKNLSQSLRLTVNWIKSFHYVPGTPTVQPSSSFMELEPGKVYVAFGNSYSQNRIIALKKRPGKTCRKLLYQQLKDVLKLNPSKKPIALRSSSQHISKLNYKLQNFRISAPKPLAPEAATVSLMDHAPYQKETSCAYKSNLILSKCTKESVLLKKLSILASKLLVPTKSICNLWPLQQVLELMVLSEKCRQLLEMLLHMDSKVNEYWSTNLYKEGIKKCSFHSSKSTKLVSHASPFIFDNPNVPVSLHIKMDSSSMLDLREVTSLPYACDTLERPTYPCRPLVRMLSLFLSQSSSAAASGGQQLSDRYQRPAEVKHPTSEQKESAEVCSQSGLHTILALSSPGCYRLWIRKKSFCSRIRAVERRFMTQLKQTFKGLRSQASKADEFFSSFPYSLGWALLMGSQHGPSAYSSNHTSAQSSHKIWQHDVSSKISCAKQSHTLLPQVPWTLQHMEAMGMSEPFCTSQSFQRIEATGIMDLSCTSKHVETMGLSKLSCTSQPLQPKGATKIPELSSIFCPLQHMRTTGISELSSQSLQNMKSVKGSDLLCLPMPLQNKGMPAELSIAIALLPVPNQKAVGTSDLPHLPLPPGVTESTATAGSLHRPQSLHNMKSKRFAGSPCVPRPLQSMATTRIAGLPHVSLTFQNKGTLAVSGLPIVPQHVLNVAATKLLVLPHVPFHNTEATETSDCELNTLEALSLHSIPKTCLDPSWMVSAREFNLHPLDEYEVISTGFTKAEGDGSCSSNTDQMKLGEERRPQRVSQIRIRKTVPKPDPNLTPMGLPRAKRLKKKEFSLEEIYTNKNYRSPPVARCLETIFEEPKEKNGSLISISQQKRKRLLEFQDFTIPRKRKSRGKLKVLSSNTRGRKAAVEGNELDAILIQKLTDLEAFLAQEDMQDGACGS